MIIGNTEPPPIPVAYQQYSEGVPWFVSLFLKVLILIAGIYALFNFIVAGYEYLGAAGDPKKIANAWTKIWQSILGLVVAAGAFTIAGLFGKLLFNDFDALLQLRIFGI